MHRSAATCESRHTARMYDWVPAAKLVLPVLRMQKEECVVFFFLSTPRFEMGSLNDFLKFAIENKWTR